MSQVALITGDATGLGSCFAATLAQQRTRVAVTCARTVQLLRSAGIESTFVDTEPVDESSAQQVVKVTEHRVGPVDILINNGWRAEDPDDWWSIIEKNLKGTLLCSKAVVPGMIHRRRGQIINVAAGGADWSKAAVIHMTEALAEKLRPHRIFVSAVCPPGVAWHSYLGFGTANKRSDTLRLRF